MNFLCKHTYRQINEKLYNFKTYLCGTFLLILIPILNLFLEYCTRVTGHSVFYKQILSVKSNDYFLAGKECARGLDTVSSARAHQ